MAERSRHGHTRPLGAPADRPGGGSGDARRETTRGRPDRGIQERDERVFTGLAVSPGVAIGPAHVRDTGDLKVVEYCVTDAQVEAEVERFDTAVRKARKQLGKVRAKAESLHGSAAEELGYLLDAHLQMLRSQSLIGGVERRIRDRQVNAECAVTPRSSGSPTTSPKWTIPT